MSDYAYPRGLALAWLSMHNIPVKETATSMRIARLLKCWDGRWWLKWYLAGVLWMARTTGLQPNRQRLEFWIERGIKVKVIHGLRRL